jgi:PPOX class probable F420-dependent enzyme
VPAELVEFLRRPNPATIATLRPDGSPHTVATWYDWEDGLVLVNMDVSRRRLGFMRNDPRVSLTALDEANWYRHVSLLGEVERIEHDAELRDIDRLSVRYMGSPFSSRDAARYSAWIRVDTWHAWDGGGPWVVSSP